MMFLIYTEMFILKIGQIVYYLLFIVYCLLLLSNIHCANLGEILNVLHRLGLVVDTHISHRIAQLVNDSLNIVALIGTIDILTIITVNKEGNVAVLNGTRILSHILVPNLDDCCWVERLHIRERSASHLNVAVIREDRDEVLDELGEVIVECADESSHVVELLIY